eukprot:164943-Rhodomonas_salina.1
MPTTRQAGKSRGEIDKIKKTAVSTRVAKKPGKKPVKPVAAGKAVVRPSKPATPTAKKIAKAKPGTQTKKGMEQKPKKLAPKPAKLPSKPVPKKKKEEEPEEEADEEEEERRLAAYLVQQRQTAVSEFRKCIASMKREKVTEVMATDHPSYDLRLGVIKHNGPATAKIHSPACGDGSFQGYALTAIPPGSQVEYPNRTVLLQLLGEWNPNLRARSEMPPSYRLHASFRRRLVD